MKKKIFVLNIIFSVFMLALFVVWTTKRSVPEGARLEYALTWYLPFAIASVFNIIGGLLILKKKRVSLAVIALIFTVIVLVLYFIALYIFPHFAFVGPGY